MPALLHPAILILSFYLLAGCIAPVVPSNDDDEDEDDSSSVIHCPPAFTSAGDYGAFTLDEWQIRMRLELLEEESELGCEVLDRLTSDLETIRSVLALSRVDQLRTVTIWIEVNLPGTPGAVYHPSAQWLENNGFPPEWAGGIQLGNARNYLEWTAVQPAIVLHEFSHAWHHQVVGYDDPDILNAFDIAMAQGLYDAVEYADGSTQSAYATTNVQEYFAELSEAWFWTNDFYPFDRSDLLQHDPLGAAVIESAWAP